MQAKHIALIAIALIIGIAIGYTPNIIAPKPTTTITITSTSPIYTSIVQTTTMYTTLYTTIASASLTTLTFTTSATLPTTIITIKTVSTSIPTTIVETVQVTWPRTIVDALGREITFNEPPKRVVSTIPSITEDLFAIGVGDRVVGVDSYSNYPPEVLDLVKQGKITVVGGPWTLDVEKIISLKPDVVFMCRDVSPQETGFRAKLEEAGIKTFFLICDAARNQYDIYADLMTLGQIFGVEDKAKEIVESMQRKIDEISSKLVNASKPRVLWLVGPPSWGLYSTGGDTFINWVITTAGGNNIASGYSKWPTLSYEFILSKDPEIIIVTVHDVDPKSVYQELVATPLVNTTAWKNGRVYLLMGEADDVVSRPGPRIVEALDILSKVIHPEIFGEVQRADVVNIAVANLEVLEIGEAVSTPPIEVA
ncbi:MAG: ABC transporter substrate-binding protein [Ignisphaera sp.]